MPKYKFDITVSMQDLGDPGEKLIKDINDGIELFGGDQKIDIRTTIGSMNVSTDKPMTQEEIEKARLLILGETKNSLPDKKLEIVFAGETK